VIRNYGVIWRARPNDHAGEHENIFVAKIADSESANAVVNYVTRLARPLNAQAVRRARLDKTALFTAFPAILTNVDADSAGVSRNVMRTRRRIVR